MGKKRSHRLAFKIGIPLFVIFLIGGIVFLYLGLNPPSGPGGPRQVWYSYDTFEEMQEAINNMEYKEDDFYLKLDYDEIVLWKCQIEGIDYCGEKTHPRKEHCNKLRSRRIKIDGSYDGGFTEVNQYYSIHFGFSSLLEKDSILQWEITPRTPIDGNSEYEKTSCYLSNQNGKDILSIVFYNISEEKINVLTQKIEELVYEFLELKK